MLSTSAWAEEQKEENIVVSASRAHRSVAEMAQTTWVIERAEIEQQVQGVQAAAWSSASAWNVNFNNGNVNNNHRNNNGFALAVRRVGQ